jgi:hypothetical protein
MDNGLTYTIVHGQPHVQLRGGGATWHVDGDECLESLPPRGGQHDVVDVEAHMQSPSATPTGVDAGTLHDQLTMPPRG